MKPILLLTLFFTLSITANAQNFEFTGYKPDTITYKRSEKNALAPGRYTFPARFSLINYAPDVKNQHPWGTCVAYSAAYCSMSIAHKLETGESVTYSPYSLYNRVKDEAGAKCNQGLYISKSLKKLCNDGCARWTNYENICKSDYTYSTYSDKMIDYDVIGISVNDFKNALTKYQPIVFAMRIFKNTQTGKRSLSSQNINESGVLVCNPNNYNSLVGGHAMCIIGYDDYKYGGAFLVQNSWGTSFGDNGRFWLPYSEVTYCRDYYSPPSEGNIDEAFSIHTRPNFLDDFTDPVDDYSDDNSKIDYFKIANYTGSLNSVWVTVAYETYDGWISRGWFECALNDEVSIDISERISDEFYWRAEGPSDNGIFWSGEGSKSFCISNEAFYRQQNRGCSDRYASFGKYIGSSGMVNLILNSSPSRGLEGKSTMSAVEAPINTTGNTIEANIDWDATSPLMDPVNNAPIVLDPSIDSEYFIWIVNDKNEAEEIVASISEIQKIKQLKFASEKTAQIHIAFSNQ
jgi:uncharacterized membrane protein